MTVADVFQLPAERGKRIFSYFSDKNKMRHLLNLQLCYLFKYAELTDAVG